MRWQKILVLLLLHFQPSLMSIKNWRENFLKKYRRTTKKCMCSIAWCLRQSHVLLVHEDEITKCSKNGSLIWELVLDLAKQLNTTNFKLMTFVWWLNRFCDWYGIGLQTIFYGQNFAKLQNIRSHLCMTPDVPGFFKKNQIL